MSAHILDKASFNTAKLVLSLLLFVLSIAVQAGENTNRSSAEPICERSDILFCENWEDGDHAGWNDFYSWDGANGYGGHTCSTGDCPFNYAGFQSNQGILLRLPENDPDTIYPRAQFNTPIGANDTVYMRYNVYWSPDFEFNLTNTKNIYFVTESGRYRVAMQFRPARVTPQSDAYESLTEAKPYIHSYTSQIEVEPGSYVDQYASSQGGDMRYFANQSGTEDFRIVGGRWYTVELRVTPNPSGRAFGGRIQFWIDGQLMADYDDVSIRKQGETDPIEGVWVSSYFGGGPQSNHPTQYVIYDNIVVARNYIGLYNGEPMPLPPPAVEEVKPMPPVLEGAQ